MKRALLGLAMLGYLAAGGCCAPGGGLCAPMMSGTCQHCPENCATCDPGGCGACADCGCEDPGGQWFFQARCRDGACGGGCGGACPPHCASGPPTGTITYPYYTVRGPRDFLARAPRPIGP